jgi:hypothetical protein
MMKCDLCKREHTINQLLCQTCSDAIHRLIVITRQPACDDAPLAQRSAMAAR